MLNRNVYDIERVADGQPGGVVLETRVFKGAVDIIFNYNFPAATNEVIKLRIFKDGKQLESYQGTQIPTQTKHALMPSADQYITFNQFQIIATYDNFVSYSFIVSVQIAQTSYYQSFDGLHVENAQFVDTADNGDMLIIMKTDDNNIINVVLHANEFVMPAAPTVAAEDILAAALSAGESTVIVPIETNDSRNIEVLS